MKNYMLFGPLLSRRLGISLGIDLMPFKICTMNCIYCESGNSEYMTLERNEYVNTIDVINELGKYLRSFPRLDYITFSGRGEPTLHSKISEITRYLKSKFPAYKLALLTNGSLFFRNDVRSDCMDYDLVIPSLDAVSPDTFQKINRPHEELSNIKIINGLNKFRNEFDNMIWLEVFIIPGINDSIEELTLLKETIKFISPDKVQLNTLDRPGQSDNVKRATNNTLLKIVKFFDPIHTDIISYYNYPIRIPENVQISLSQILSLLERRPCTFYELSRILGFNKSRLNKQIQTLLTDKLITTKETAHGKYFVHC